MREKCDQFKRFERQACASHQLHTNDFVPRSLTRPRSVKGFYLIFQKPPLLWPIGTVSPSPSQYLNRTLKFGSRWYLRLDWSHKPNSRHILHIESHILSLDFYADKSGGKHPSSEALALSLFVVNVGILKFCKEIWPQFNLNPDHKSLQRQLGRRVSIKKLRLHAVAIVAQTAGHRCPDCLHPSRPWAQ